MNPVDHAVAALLCPAACCPPPASVAAWATAAAGTGPDAIARRAARLEQHRKLVAFAIEQRALGAAEERVRAAAGEGAPDAVPPVVWSAAFVLDRMPFSWKRAAYNTIPLRPGTPQRAPRRPCPHCKGVLELMTVPYTPEKMREDQAEIVKAAAGKAPEPPWRGWPGVIVLAVEARIVVPKSWDLWMREAALAGHIRPTSGHGGKGAVGDASNCLKQVEDALTSAKDPRTEESLWWRDDAQVVHALARKVYAERPSWKVEAYFLREVASKAEWEAFKAERGITLRAGKPAQRSLLEEVA